MQVLIVEDDHFYAQRICELLQDRGVETSIVRSAEEALSDLTAFDGAVIDVMLPNDASLSGISHEESQTFQALCGLMLVMGLPLRERRLEGKSRGLRVHDKSRERFSRPS